MKHEKWALDKHIWKLYKSADAHTNKAKLPRVLYWLQVIGLVIGGAIFFLYHDFKKRIDPSEAAKAVGAQAPGGARATGAVGASADPFAAVRAFTDSVTEWKQAEVPLDPSRPESASKYDDIREVKTFPRLAAAVVSATGCRAYTQQATLLVVSQTDCYLFAAVSRFNDYADEQSDVKDSRTELAQQRQERIKASAGTSQAPYVVHGLGGTVTLERAAAGYSLSNAGLSSALGAGAPGVLGQPGQVATDSAVPGQRSTASGPGRGGYVQ